MGGMLILYDDKFFHFEIIMIQMQKVFALCIYIGKFGSNLGIMLN